MVWWLLLGPVQAEGEVDAVALPDLTFSMGSEREPDEQPVHDVTVPAFSMDRREVRLSEYQATGASGVGAGPDHPVVGVTWHEAVAYCEARGGRLPTETEWERACRGASGGVYPWGDNPEVEARWWDESLYGKHGRLWGIMTRPEDLPQTRSAEGIEELAGNVWEWTSSGYHRDAYKGASTEDSPWKVIRGGSYSNLPSYGTCTHREPALPDQARLTLGFRCVYSSQP